MSSLQLGRTLPVETESLGRNYFVIPSTNVELKISPAREKTQVMNGQYLKGFLMQNCFEVPKHTKRIGNFAGGSNRNSENLSELGTSGELGKAEVSFLCSPADA